jgi:hypothetical protein
MRNTFSHHQTTEPEVMQPTEHYTQEGRFASSTSSSSRQENTLYWVLTLRAFPFCTAKSILIKCKWVYFLIKTGNSALKTREKPYYGKNSRKALVSSIPLNIMEHVIADLVFIFRLQPFTMQNHIKISPETIDSNVPEMNFHWFTIKICVKAQPFHPKSLPLLKINL